MGVLELGRAAATSVLDLSTAAVESSVRSSSQLALIDGADRRRGRRRLPRIASCSLFFKLRNIPEAPPGANLADLSKRKDGDFSTPGAWLDRTLGSSCLA